MIASVQGLLLSVGEDNVIVRVGGVGLQISVPIGVINEFSAELGQTVELQTELVVREDSLTLFGFLMPAEKVLFQQLLNVSGIGPRIALAVLSTLTPETLANAVQQEQADVIARVPGIGKKTAQRVILDLKGKLLPVDLPAGFAAVSDLDTEVLEALTTLGYSVVEAQAAIQAIPRDAVQDVEERIILALQYFS